MLETCTLEIHLAGAWRRCAELTRIGPGETRRSATHLAYDFDYAADQLEGTGNRALSVRFDVDFTLHSLDNFPSFVIDLMPQGEGRRLAEARLRRDGREATDWSVLVTGAGNPTGNVRVAEAVGEQSRPSPGFERERIIARGDAVRGWALEQGMSMRGSTDTAGASPKLLLTQDRAGLFHADGALSDSEGARHWSIKFPRGRTRDDARVLANEPPYLEVARRVGLRVGEPLAHEGGALFVPRFDRRVVEGSVHRLGMESLYAVCGVVEAGEGLVLEDAVRSVASVIDDPESDVVELVLRDALSLALGNTDNHGRNTSLLKETDGSVRVSPLYDFAPMLLDPEGIVRTARWRSERGRRVDWGDVVENLADLVHPDRLREALLGLADRLEGGQALLLECGVDAELTERVTPRMEQVSQDLRES